MDTKYLFLKDNTWVFRIRIPKEFQFYYENNKEYSKVKQQNYELIKALHESGLGYRRIANHLNAIEIKTKKEICGSIIMFIQLGKKTRKNKIE